MCGFRRGLALAAILLVGLEVGCSDHRGTPRIELPRALYDVGEIRQGEVVMVELPVRNIGRADLHIEAVSTSCGCTEAAIEPRVIARGGEATLSVRYDSGVHPDSGSVHRIIYIASDDPDKPEVEVEILAEVRPQ